MPIICASTYVALAAAGVDSIPTPQRFDLACSGTLVASAGNAANSAILADGHVDIARGNVRGFGLGGQPIYAVDTARIAFGSGLGATGDRLIEGTIDRATLETRILVRSVEGGGDPVIAMRLDCRVASPPSA